MLDIGILYVFKSRFSREVKIGKTTIGNLKIRKRTVDRSNKTHKMRIAFFAIVFNTSSLEKRLHRRYRKYKKKKPKSVSGSTEFFNLYVWQRLDCYLEITLEAFTQWVLIGLVFLFAYLHLLNC